MQGPGERFRETPDLGGEIVFWSRQLSEHCLFLHLGVEIAADKAKALTLRRRWEELRPRLSALPPSRAEAAAKKLTTETQDLLAGTLARQEAGEWVGFLHPLFVDHLRREGEYFQAELDGFTLTRVEKFCFWLRLAAEHAALAAHWLDPTEAARIRRALDILAAIQGIRESGCPGVVTQSLLEITTRAGSSLDAYLGEIEATPPRGVLHPALVEHIRREGRMFLAVLEGLLT